VASLSELPWRLVMWLAHRRVVEGFDVRVVESRDVDRVEVFSRVGEALRLIFAYGPRFFGRMRRDVKSFLFSDRSGGSYLAGLETCCIGIDYVLRVAPLELAMMIVHEATHARLARAGFRYSEECRERIERICVEAEVIFAQRVPDSDAAVSRARKLLETRWWTSENSMDAALGELASRGVPTWIIRILRRISLRKRVRRSDSRSGLVG